MKTKIRKKAYSVQRVTKKSTPRKTMAVPVKSGIKKQYLKSADTCRVTFRLPKDAAPNASKVSIVGDFNEWKTGQTVMKRLKNGDYTVTLPLSRNREYRFKYFIDDTRWENDWCADKYSPDPFGWEDSVVVV